MPMKEAPQVKPRRKYEFKPETKKVLAAQALLQARVDKLKKLIHKKAKYVKAVEAATQSLARFERRIAKVKKELIRGIK